MSTETEDAPDLLFLLEEAQDKAASARDWDRYGDAMRKIRRLLRLRKEAADEALLAEFARDRAEEERRRRAELAEIHRRDEARDPARSAGSTALRNLRREHATLKARAKELAGVTARLIELGKIGTVKR